MSQTTSLDWPRRAPTVVAAPAAAVSTKGVTALLGVYLVMHLIPTADILVGYLGVRVPVVVITGAIVMAVFLLSGRTGRFWTVPMARPWIALFALLTTAAVFGGYPTLSVPFILEIGARFYVLPFFCCAFAITAPRVRQLLYCIAGGTMVLLLLCAQYGELVEGRLVLPFTQLENPNDLAFTIICGMPALLLLAYARSAFARTLWFVAFPVSILYVLKTGSRGSFVTLVVLTAALFWLVRGRSRTIMLLLAPVLGLAMLTTIPPETWTRLTLIVTDPLQTEAEVDDLQLRGALGSQAARIQLQKRAVELSLRNPLFGVGPLMFDDAVDLMVRQETGERSTWQGAHNTYLTIAAENGLPAFVFYVWIVGLCWKLNYRAYRTCQMIPSQKDNVPQSLCLILMTLAFCVGILFSNMAYTAHICVLTGLSAANYLAIRAELDVTPKPTAA